MSRVAYAWFCTFTCLLAGTAVLASMMADRTRDAWDGALRSNVIAPPPQADRPKVEVDYQAQQAETPEIDGKQGLFIGAINVEGAPDLPASLFSDAIEPFLGKNLSPAELAALCRTVAEVARAIADRHLPGDAALVDGTF